MADRQETDGRHSPVRRGSARRGTALLLVAMLAGADATLLSGENSPPERKPVRAPRPESTTAEHPAQPEQSPESERLPLTAAEHEKLDRTVDKGLDYLLSRQDTDGSFHTAALARPAVTALCVMAFLSRGYKPGEGNYSGAIERAIDYVLDCQEGESGVFLPPQSGDGGRRRGVWSRAVNYTHGICSTMLADVYPLTGRLQYRRDPLQQELRLLTQKSTGKPAKKPAESRRKVAPSKREQSLSGAAKVDLRRHERVEKAVRKALAYTRREQMMAKVEPGNSGGWRYIDSSDSDLSVTAWQIMFLHSAHQSGFKVPDNWMKGGLRFVHHTYNKKVHGFVYTLSSGIRHATRATVGGGLLCLVLGGEPVSVPVRDAAIWISGQSFEPYNGSWEPGDRYHYSAFYCSQAMGLLGGEYFKGFYPNLLRVLSENQHADGSWDPESFHGDTVYGEVYTTALSVLALSPPYQKLKTYQR